jgi:hypothetical protein
MIVALDHNSDSGEPQTRFAALAEQPRRASDAMLGAPGLDQTIDETKKTDGLHGFNGTRSNSPFSPSFSVFFVSQLVRACVSAQNARAARR